MSPEFALSSGSETNAYWQDSDACHPGEYMVTTDQGGAFSDDVAFTILVP